MVYSTSTQKSIGAHAAIIKSTASVAATMFTNASEETIWTLSSGKYRQELQQWLISKLFCLPYFGIPKKYHPLRMDGLFNRSIYFLERVDGVKCCERPMASFFISNHVWKKKITMVYYPFTPEGLIRESLYYLRISQSLDLENKIS